MRQVEIAYLFPVDIRYNSSYNQDSRERAKIKEEIIILYFAYGSNLNERQMKARCPKAKKLNKATLAGYQLDFLRGIATVDKAQHGIDCLDYVEGGLWEITPDCLEALDEYEGYPKLYQRKIVNVLDDNGTYRKAITYYIVKPGLQRTAIPASYLNTIIQGYKDFEMSLKYLKAVFSELGASEATINTWIK